LENIVRIEIDPDYERAESSGAGGLFQVISIYGYDSEDNRIDLTDKIDQGDFFETYLDVIKAIGLDPDKIHMEI
jgi:hypothetical protein